MPDAHFELALNEEGGELGLEVWEGGRVGGGHVSGAASGYDAPERCARGLEALPLQRQV